MFANSDDAVIFWNQLSQHHSCDEGGRKVIGVTRGGLFRRESKVEFSYVAPRLSSVDKFGSMLAGAGVPKSIPLDSQIEELRVDGLDGDSRFLRDWADLLEPPEPEEGD